MGNIPSWTSAQSLWNTLLQLCTSCPTGSLPITWKIYFLLGLQKPFQNMPMTAPNPQWLTWTVSSMIWRFAFCIALPSLSFFFYVYYCMMHLLVGFRPRYGSSSVEHDNLDNSVFEDAALAASPAPRAMFDEDQEQPPQNEPPPMHRSKSSLGAQSRGTARSFTPCFLVILSWKWGHA